MSGNLTAVRKSNKSDYLVKVGDFQGNIAVSKNCYWNRIGCDYFLSCLLV